MYNCSNVEKMLKKSYASADDKCFHCERGPCHERYGNHWPTGQQVAAGPQLTTVATLPLSSLVLRVFSKKHIHQR